MDSTEEKKEGDLDSLDLTTNGINFKYEADDLSLEVIRNGGFLALRDLTGINGPNYDISIGLYSIQDLLVDGVGPVFFEDSNLGKYRVLYIARPTLGTRANASIPTPAPPFFGTFRTKAYAFGVLVDGPSSSPKQSGWISLGDVQLDFS